MAGSSFAKGSNLLAGKGRSLLNVACERVCARDQKTGSERASRTCATSGRRHAFRRRSHLAGATLALHGASVAISGETGTAAAAWSMLPVDVVESCRSSAPLQKFGVKTTERLAESHTARLCEQTSRLCVERGVRQHYAVVGQQRHERAYPRPRAAERIDTPG